jgi:long-chain acyl-CoA synthetase
VRLASDGEVLVRGPQVTGGYFGSLADGLLRDGWLPTGDFGALTPEGSLVIRGRKKELLVTSYGKNIHPAKIEGLLRRIPGLAEAMVLGDNRPALCALLWLGGGSATPSGLRSIDEAVCRVNEGLSHPEQLKRWAVLAERPDIDSGELTGNLKIRRQVVSSRRAEVIEMLYRDMAGAGSASECEATAGVLHVGAIQCA